MVAGHLARPVTRRRGLLLFAVLFASYAYFYQAGGWNQNSRFALVRALVEAGTLRIDAYHESTGDKVLVGRHVYSDKAPGAAFAAAPFVALARPLVEAPQSEAGVALLSYVATLAAAALPTALAGVLLFALALRLGASQAGAAFAALAFGLGTPAWATATLFFGHALAMACLLAAFAAALALHRRSSSRRDVLLALGLGLAGGWAVMTEFPCAPPVVAIAALGLAHAWPQGRARRLRVALGIGAAGAAAALGLALYNTAAFGGPLSVGYGKVPGFPEMQQGFLGLTYPKPGALGEILFGSYRGLLPLAPLLAAAPLGWIIWLRAGRDRAAAYTAIGIGLYFLLFNASYAYWEGGWSFGPRHVTPALPFLCLPLALLFTRARAAAARAVLVALALWGVGVSLVAVSTTPQLPERFRHPMSQLLWPAFAEGDLALGRQSYLDRRGYPLELRGGARPRVAWNAGQRLGLEGHASLVPLLASWGLFAVGWLAAGRERTP